MDPKTVYQPIELLKLRHSKRYDNIELNDLLRQSPKPHQAERKTSPIYNSTQPIFYPVTAFILIHQQQQQQQRQRQQQRQYFQNDYEYYYPRPSYPISPHNLYTNSSFPLNTQPPLYVTPLSPISPLQHRSVSIAIPILQIEPIRQIPIGGIPLQGFYQSPCLPPPSVEPSFKFFSPTSPPNNKENDLELDKPENNNDKLNKVQDYNTTSDRSSSSFSSCSASSSDIIIQI